MEGRKENIRIVPLGTKYLESTNIYATDLQNTKYMMFLPNESMEETKMFLENVEKELGVKHFIAHCDSENVGSYRTMEKLGMKRVCVNEGRKNRASDEIRREFRYEM